MLLSKSFLRRTFMLLNQQARHLNLHEFQCKRILQDNGVAVQRFVVVEDKQEINTKLGDFHAEEYVVKAQVLAGGRGKGIFKNSELVGGVQLTKDPGKAAFLVDKMLGDYLVTKQTTQDGALVERVMVAEAVNIKREFYFSIILDRSYDSGPIFVTSPCGGVDIEEISAKDKKLIRTFTLPLDTRLDLEAAHKIVVRAFDMNLNDSDLIKQCADQIIKLYNLFLRLDATQIEINPLGITNKRKVICVDAKFQFDENARFRQHWLDNFNETNKPEDQREAEAKKHNLNFISLDGNIGCLVNGAGLAMATMDLIKLNGGEPANFLDVGGSASSEQIFQALKILVLDENVKSILVNIFGGIMRCDLVAEGLTRAVRNLRITRPVVVRLHGSQVEEARKIIKSCQSDIIMVDDMDEAAQLAADMSKFSIC